MVGAGLKLDPDVFSPSEAEITVPSSQEPGLHHRFFMLHVE